MTRAEALAVGAAVVLAVAGPVAAQASAHPGVGLPVVVAAAVPAVVPLRRAVWAFASALLAAAVVAVVLASGADRGPTLTWLGSGLLGALAVAAVGRRQRASARERWLDAERRQAAGSVRDDLTGCCNHAGMMLFGEHLLHGVRRRGEAMHALVVAVDQLDRVQEQLGRAGVDEVLAAVADALRSSTRQTDVVGRDEDGGGFSVVGPGGGVSPGEVERRVRAHLIEAPPAPPRVWPCRVTVGVAVLEPWDDADLAALLLRAHEDLGLRVALRAPSAPEPLRRTDGRSALG